MQQQPRLRRTLSLVLPLVALFGATIPATALAKKRPRKDSINKLVDDGAKAVKATKPQRAQAHECVKELTHAVEDAFGPVSGTFPEQDEVLRLFVAPTADTKMLDALRDRRDQRHDTVGNGLVVAFTKIHRILDPAQREKLVEWAKKKALGKQMSALKQKLVVGVINTVVEALLEQIGATEPERVVARSVRDRVATAILEVRGDPVQQADELGALFTAPEVDLAALDKFRVAHEAQIKALLITLEQAFVQLHDALTPEHRQRLAAIVQNETLSKSSTSDDSDTSFQ